MIPSRPTHVEEVRFAVDPKLAVRLRAAQQRVGGVAASDDESAEQARDELAAVEALLDEPGASMTFRVRRIGVARWLEAASGADDPYERAYGRIAASCRYVADDDTEHDLDDADIARIREEWTEPEVAQLVSAARAVNELSAGVNPKGLTTTS